MKPSVSVLDAPLDAQVATIDSSFRDHAPVASDEYRQRVDVTDTGLVNQLVRLTSGNLRHVTETKQWWRWTGERWERDHTQGHQAVHALADHWHQSQAERGVLASTLKARKSLEKRCRSKAGARAIIELAATREEFMISIDLFDRDPHLLGVKNGVVDLRTGTLRTQAREDYIMKSASVAFDPNAAAPIFERFVDHVMSTPGKTPRDFVPAHDKVVYVQRLAGYLLTGLTREHKAFNWTGVGSNGKNVLIDSLARVMGGYAVELEPKLLTGGASRGDANAASPAIVALRGKRLAYSSETAEGDRLDVTVFKRLTGDAKVTGRGLYREQETVDVTFKMALLTNHVLEIARVDPAIAGRVHVLPFEMRWNRPGTVDHDPNLPDGDKTLADQLKAEDAGILAWAIRGAIEYFQHGLVPPREVVEATTAYLRGQKAVEDWIAVEMQHCDPSDGLSPTAALDAFNAWCERLDIKTMTANKFGRRMKQFGVEIDRASGERRYGLRQKTKA